MTAHKRRENGDGIKPTPVSLDIIGHSHLISLEQQQQEEALRQRAALPRPINSNLGDRLGTVQIPTETGNVFVTGPEGAQIGLGILRTEESSNFKELSRLSKLIEEHRKSGGNTKRHVEEADLPIKEYREAKLKEREEFVAKNKNHVSQLADLEADTTQQRLIDHAIEHRNPVLQVQDSQPRKASRMTKFNDMQANLLLERFQEIILEGQLSEDQFFSQLAQRQPLAIKQRLAEFAREQRSEDFHPPRNQPRKRLSLSPRT